MNTHSRLPGLVVAASLAVVLLGGCHVTETGTGPNKKVDIGTPFGSVKVNTSGDADLAAIGLSAYPGAVPVKEEGKDHDDANNADVNLSFGDFHLGVKAATFQTADQPDKVLAFYRKDLHTRYGDVIACRGDAPFGQPTRTAQGLTCNDNAHSKIQTHDPEDKDLELRSGSQQHQHIVSVSTKDSGTKIGLVALDLPSHMGKDSDKSPE